MGLPFFTTPPHVPHPPINTGGWVDCRSAALPVLPRGRRRLAGASASARLKVRSRDGAFFFSCFALKEGAKSDDSLTWLAFLLIFLPSLVGLVMMKVALAEECLMGEDLVKNTTNDLVDFVLLDLRSCRFKEREKWSKVFVEKGCIEICGDTRHVLRWV